jgi:hypothetical protein
MNLAAILVAGLLALAQAPARDVTASLGPLTGTGGISGVVLDHARKPVRRALVTIAGDMRLTRSTTTDDEGRFVFAELPGGRFTVSAEKAGYPQMSFGAKRSGRAGSGVFLQDGEHARDLMLSLPRGAVMTGTVYDEHGAPLPGVPVMAWEVRTSLSGERTLASGESVTVVTDDRGAYRVFGLPAGDYTIGTSWYYHGGPTEVRIPTEAEFKAAFEPAAAVQTPSGAARPPVTPAPEPPRYNYSPVFAPGVTDPLSATTLTLAAGDVRENVDLRMVFQPMSRIEGRVLNLPSGPASNRLSITRRSPVQALNTTQVSGTAPDGKFATGSLSPGLYTVAVQTRATADTPAMWAMADVVLGSAEPAVVTLTLEPAVTVAGRLEFDKGTLPPPPDTSKAVVSFFAVGPLNPESTTKVDAAGALLISGVIPGRYMIRASFPTATAPGAPAGVPAWTVRSVTVGGIDVTDKPFDVPASGVSDVVVTFTDQISELSGTLTTPTGEPEPDYFVIAIPADRAYWTPLSRRIMSTRPDGAGRFVFRGLPAGEYRIAVTTDLVPLDLREVSTLEQLALASLPVTLTTGQRHTLDLRTTGK